MMINLQIPQTNWLLTVMYFKGMLELNKTTIKQIV